MGIKTSNNTPPSHRPFFQCPQICCQGTEEAPSEAPLGPPFPRGVLPTNWPADPICHVPLLLAPLLPLPNFLSMDLGSSPSQEFLEHPHCMQSHIPPWEGVTLHLVICFSVGTCTRFGLRILTFYSDWGSGKQRTLFPPKPSSSSWDMECNLPRQTGSSRRTESGGRRRQVSALTCVHKAWLQFLLLFLHTPLDDIIPKEETPRSKTQCSLHMEHTAS